MTNETTLDGLVIDAIRTGKHKAGDIGRYAGANIRIAAEMRAVDRSLQRQRKKGLIYFTQGIGWRLKADSPAP